MFKLLLGDGLYSKKVALVPRLSVCKQKETNWSLSYFARSSHSKIELFIDHFTLKNIPNYPPWFIMTIFTLVTAICKSMLMSVQSQTSLRVVHRHGQHKPKLYCLIVRPIMEPVTQSIIGTVVQPITEEIVETIAQPVLQPIIQPISKLIKCS